MASNDKWIKRVLIKLNELFLEGSDFDDRRWIFDWDDKLSTDKNLENVWNEDRALETLTKAEVIKSRSLDNRYRNEVLNSIELHGEDATVYGDWRTTDPAHREYEYERWIDGFNYKNFQRFCELHGFNPSNNGILVKLEIGSGVTPVVNAQGVKYRLTALGAGTIPQEIIQYASKNFDEELSIEVLRTVTKNIQLKADSANIKQFFRKNVFGSNGVLAPFADISSKSFSLKSTAILSPSELAAIEKSSTS